MPHASMRRRCADLAGSVPLGQIGDHAAAKDLITIQQALLRATPGRAGCLVGFLGPILPIRARMAGDLTAHHRGATPNQVSDTRLGQAHIHPRHDRRAIPGSKHPTTPHDQPPNNITTTRKLLTPYDTAETTAYAASSTPADSNTSYTLKCEEPSNLSAKILREYSPSTSKRSDAAISTERFSSLMLISIKSLMRFCGNVSLLLPLMQSLPTHASNYGCCGIPLTDERIQKLATASDSRAAIVSQGTRTSPQGSRLLASPRPSNEHNKPGRPSCRTRRARTLPRPCPGSST